VVLGVELCWMGKIEETMGVNPNAFFTRLKLPRQNLSHHETGNREVLFRTCRAYTKLYQISSPLEITQFRQPGGRLPGPAAPATALTSHGKAPLPAACLPRWQPRSPPPSSLAQWRRHCCCCPGGPRARQPALPAPSDPCGWPWPTGPKSLG
jgi:hypothetical protein